MNGQESHIQIILQVSKVTYFISTKDTMRVVILYIVQFQKISMPTLWKVNGNSKGVGGLESQNFKRNVWGLTGISRGVGGF